MFRYICIFILALPSFSVAYKSQKLDIPISSKIDLKKLKNNSWGLDLDTQKQDQALKKEMQMNRFQIDDFSTEDFVMGLAKESGEFGDEKVVEQAKGIARLVMVQHLQNNWSQLKSTILNISNNSQFNNFAHEIKEQLRQRTIYKGRHKDTNRQYFEFSVADWGFVQISTDLKLANVVVSFDTNADNNKIDPAVLEIKTVEKN